MEWHWSRGAARKSSWKRFSFASGEVQQSVFTPQTASEWSYSAEEGFLCFRGYSISLGTREVKAKSIFLSLLSYFQFYRQFGFRGHSRWKPEQVYNHLGVKQGSWNPRIGAEEGAEVKSQDPPPPPQEKMQRLNTWYGISVMMEAVFLDGK